MAHKISDECISCGSCEASCPVAAISQGADHYEIDPDACIDCGTCAEGCPVNAIAKE
ncbi:MAG: 4Fe-4S binding protein [Clostridiales bacterium]|jgi:ferredoxin|nr:4Fe-4S binding protein [Clostridiales bacterium]